MKILIWIVQIVLAIVFLASGSMKLITPYAEMVVTEGMAWAEDFSEMQIKIIAILEVLAGLGLIVPMFIKKIGMLVPIAALGLSIIMIGAIVTHIGRGEPVYVNIVLLAMALLTAWWRSGMLKKA